MLDRRQAHLKALSDIFCEQQYVECEALKKALGNEVA